MVRRHERIYLVGYYGWCNYGDELFRVVLRRYRVAIWGRGTTLRIFIVPIGWIRRQSGLLGAFARCFYMILGSLWATRIVLGGGSVLSDVRGTHGLCYRLFRGKREWEALGVSIGPFSDECAKTRVELWLADMRRVVVRDVESQNRSHVPVRVAGDLAALYPMPCQRDDLREGLVICPSADSRMPSQEIADFLGGLLSSNPVVSVTLLALNSRPRRGDVDYCRAIAARLSTRGIETNVRKFANVEGVIDTVSHARAVWSQRLHGSITAYLCDVPFLALGHHVKIRDFAADIGLAEEFVVRRYDSKAYADAARQVLAGIRGWSVAPSVYVEKVRRGYGV